jgi:ABC-type molybdenum transport system ATPase subunit/photorepair protein PhrA
MCTHIIDFQDRTLKTFKGITGKTLTHFVGKHPEKSSHFELSNELMKFTFPEPGAMEGVKSRSKVILRMNNVSFTYPTKDKPTVVDLNLTVPQVSRVAVIGASGAGKSTLSRCSSMCRSSLKALSGRPRGCARRASCSTHATTWSSTCRSRPRHASCGGSLATTIRSALSSSLKNCRSTKQRHAHRYPEKSSYFELSDELMKFTFPEPGAM